MSYNYNIFWRALLLKLSIGINGLRLDKIFVNYFIIPNRLFFEVICIK